VSRTKMLTQPGLRGHMSEGGQTRLATILISATLYRTPIPGMSLFDPISRRFLYNTNLVRRAERQ